MSIEGSRYPIFVPSKGRADCAKVAGALRSGGLPFTFVVEPQDEAEYRRVHPWAEVLVLDSNDRGIVFVRQFILDYARKQGYPFYWQIDDNIRAFYEVIQRKCLQVPACRAIGYAEDLADHYQKIGMVALQYQQFAWSAHKAYQFNRQAYCCVLTNTQTGLNYRPGTEMKEDIDFLLQHLATGWHSILVNRFAMGKPPMGKNAKGGLSSLYKQGLNSAAAKVIVGLWPQYCSLVPKEGGLDAKIDWAKFA